MSDPRDEDLIKDMRAYLAQIAMDAARIAYLEGEVSRLRAQVRELTDALVDKLEEVD